MFYLLKQVKNWRSVVVFICATEEPNIFHTNRGIGMSTLKFSINKQDNPSAVANSKTFISKLIKTNAIRGMSPEIVSDETSAHFAALTLLFSSGNLGADDLKIVNKDILFKTNNEYQFLNLSTEILVDPFFSQKFESIGLKCADAGVIISATGFDKNWDEIPLPNIDPQKATEITWNNPAIAHIMIILKIAHGKRHKFHLLINDKKIHAPPYECDPQVGNDPP